MDSFKSQDIVDAISKLQSDDYAWKSLLDTIKIEVDKWIQIDKTSIWWQEIQKIINSWLYDFQILHDWVHGELQILMFQVKASPQNNVVIWDVERSINQLDPDDYAWKSLLNDILFLLKNGKIIAWNSSGGIEISKLLSGKSYDFDILNAWVDEQVKLITESTNVHKIENFQNIITWNILVLEKKSNQRSIEENDFYNKLTSLDVMVKALGLTTDDIALYEAYIWARMLWQIDSNWNPIKPEVRKALTSSYMSRSQKFFYYTSGNIVWDSIESAYKWWNPSYKEFELVQWDDKTELHVRDVKSIFQILLNANTEIQSWNISQTTLDDFSITLSRFSEDIQNMRRIAVSNAFLDPKWWVWLKSTWFDSAEDWLWRDFEEEWILMEKAYNWFHGINNTSKMSLHELADIWLNYSFDYTLISNGAIDSILAEMRDWWPNWSSMPSVDQLKYKSILEKLSTFNTRAIIDPLREELEYLQNWAPPMQYEPFINIGSAVIWWQRVSFDSYGPYKDPREKALMITMLLSVFHGLEKSPEWQTYWISYLPWLIDKVGLIGWEDDGLIVWAFLSIVSYNTLATTIWKRASYWRINLSSLNPMKLLSGWRNQKTESNPNETSISNKPPEWYTSSKFSEQERKIYDDLVAWKHEKVEHLSLDDTRRLQDTIKLMRIAQDMWDLSIYSQLKKLGQDTLNNPVFAAWWSAAYANDRFWKMKIFQIMNKRGGIYSFLFDDNSLRHPRISSQARGWINTWISWMPNLERAWRTVWSSYNWIANQPHGWNLLNLDGSTAYNMWPIFQNRDTIKLQEWNEFIFRRYNAVNTSFTTLKDFEKYRPDLAGDSGLKKAEAEIEEMRKQFLQGKMVELHPAGHPDAWKPVRNAEGKLKFIASDMKASGDAIGDFEKLLSDWMKKANTGFDLDYGKALKVDVIPDSDRANENSQEKVRLGKATEYAEAKGDDTMKQKIAWLERTLTEQVTVTVKEWEQETTKTEYKEHMTKTEFYTRLTMILEGKAWHDTALPITDKSTFEKKKAEIASVLSGGDSTKNYILRKIMDPKTVEGLNEKSFDPKKLNIKESAEWDMLTKARLYALSQWDERLLKELNSPRTVAKGVTTISWFESRLKKLGIPANIDFQTHISSFRAQAESKIITLSDGSRFYIEDILPGDEAEIRQELINKKIAQEREIKAKTREKIDAERVLLNEILWEMNSRDGVIRKVSIKEIFIGAIKTVF